MCACLMDDRASSVLSVVFYTLVVAMDSDNSTVHILQSPMDTSVCLNSTASFYCSTNGHSVVWRVNETRINYFPQLVLTISPRNDFVESNLLVPGTVKFNNTSIYCIGVNFDGSKLAKSTPVQLKLQGPPSPPPNLTATPLNETSIKLTWSVPPGVLDEELISYLVEVRNESGGLTLQSETEGTEYSFSMDNPDPCDLYSFTVTPLCDTVEGGTSAEVNGTFLAVSDIRVSVKVFITTDQFMVLFDFMFLDEVRSCPGRMGEDVIVIIETKIILVSTLEIVITANTTSRLLNISDDFPSNQFFTAYITLQNCVVTCEAIEIEFSTFDVSSASASFSGGLACDFIEGSDARGCFFILISDTHLVHYAVLQRNGSSPVAMGSVGGVERGEYVGFVYDIESSGVPSLMPATRDNLTFSVTEDLSTSPTVSLSDLISRDGLGVTVGCPVDAGCVVISQVEGSVEISVEELKNGAASFPLEPGRHRVAVFERGQDGVIGGLPLDVELVQVNLKPISTASTPSFPSPYPSTTIVPSPSAPSSDCDVWCLAGVASGVLFFASLSVIVVILLKLKRLPCLKAASSSGVDGGFTTQQNEAYQMVKIRETSSRSSGGVQEDHSDLKTQQNEAYQMVQVKQTMNSCSSGGVQEQVKMDECPAYGVLVTGNKK